MDVLAANNQSYWDMVHTATKRNTLVQASEAKQSGTPLNVEEVQQSNQQLKDSARETGTELYGLQLTKQAFETYARTTENQSNSSDDSSDDKQEVYSFDSKNVNEMSAMAQQRALGTALYSNFKEQAESTHRVDYFV